MTLAESVWNLHRTLEAHNPALLSRIHTKPTIEALRTVCVEYGQPEPLPSERVAACCERLCAAIVETDNPPAPAAPIQLEKP
jgi:hypothetical protein